MELEVKASVSLKAEYIRDILINLVETGGEWVDYYRKPKMTPAIRAKIKAFDPKEEYSDLYNMPFCGGSIEIGWGAEEDDKQRCFVGLDELKKGLQILADKYPHHMADLLHENDDILTADALFQCACMGELVYG